jgi:putative hydrolase of the HAD superfamily
MAIECITFDLDDTLWEVGPVIMRAEREFYDWLSRRCPRISEAFDLEALTQHRRAYFRQFPQRMHDLTGLRKLWLAHIFETFGYGEVSVDMAFHVFWEHRNAVELFEEAPPVLDLLRECYRLGVITNGNACVHHIGIGHLFDFVVSSESAGHSKPAPQIFHAALECAGVEPRRVIHVGDDARNDVLGAAGVGMRTVWYNPTLKPWPGGAHPDAVIRSMAELNEAVTRIAG